MLCCIMLSVIMQIVIILSLIMLIATILRVVAPFKYLAKQAMMVGGQANKLTKRPGTVSKYSTLNEI